MWQRSRPPLSNFLDPPLKVLTICLLWQLASITKHFSMRVSNSFNWSIASMLIVPATVFSTSDMDQLRKILAHHWKERLKISKIAKFKSDTS